MKKCPWCEREYPDEASTCEADGKRLKTVSPASPAPGAAAQNEPDAAEIYNVNPQIDAGEESEEEDEFRCVGGFNPFEAERLLKRFEEEGIQFQIDQVEKVVPMAGHRKRSLIEIFVHRDQEEKARDIISESAKL